jgi:hypothetical protein
LKRWANVLETVSFSGRDRSVMTGWSRQSRSTLAIALRLTIVARWICQNSSWSSASNRSFDRLLDQRFGVPS